MLRPGLDCRSPAGRASGWHPVAIEANDSPVCQFATQANVADFGADACLPAVDERRPLGLTLAGGEAWKSLNRKPRSRPSRARAKPASGTACTSLTAACTSSLLASVRAGAPSSQKALASHPQSG